MRVERYDNGVPSWVDLGTTNLEAATSFYSALFGWETPAGPPEAGGYIVALSDGQPVAGLGPRMNPDAPVAWNTYVNVDDADAVVAKATAAGANVLMGPMDVLDVGRMAMLADPAGAVFGIWQPRAHIGARVVNEPNTWCWSELVTTDVEGATAFYSAIFGWTTNALSGGPVPYWEWRIGDRPVGGMIEKPPMMPAEVPPHWGVYFAVSSLEETLARIPDLNGAVLMEPMDVEVGRFSVAFDSAGAVFNVIELRNSPGT